MRLHLIPHIPSLRYCRHPRVAVRGHREALQALRTFWQLLQHASVRFEDLAAAACDIDAAIRNADKIYRCGPTRHR